ncbi:MAG TPA: polysaccharide deacetylase family protein [bacterium]|nr:polysaccharide deacetylase family protein [bacterium]
MANPIVLIVGRLSGPKNQVILHILRSVAPVVAQKVPGVRFEVVGGPVAEEHRELEKQLSNLRFGGYQKHLTPFYRKATVVVGAGRVALEAMALKKPVVAIGERLYVGPLSPDNVETAKATNFGDCFEKEDFDWHRMARELTELLKNPKKRAQAAKTGLDLVHAEYDLEKVVSQTETLYQKVLLDKNVSRFHELPVLMYHRVVEKALTNSKYNVYVTRETLEEQMRFLKDRGFETITFGDLLTRRIPEKPVILTFDDGYEDNYLYLLPLLKKYGMKAVVYILGDRKHKTNFWDIPQGEPEAVLLKEKQIKEMDESGLVEFGAHSMNHSKLTELKPAEIRREVEGSKKALEKLLGKPVMSFAYPFGLLNEEIKKITAEAGYTFGIAVKGRFTRFGQDLMEIRRVHMFPQTSLLDFWKKTSGFYHRYRKWMGRS